jgi:hypothetical protein
MSYYKEIFKDCIVGKKHRECFLKQSTHNASRIFKLLILTLLVQFKLHTLEEIGTLQCSPMIILKRIGSSF